MEHSTRPDIIVAVDLGSTFTGGFPSSLGQLFSR